jgi:hypothetical protein
VLPTQPLCPLRRFTRPGLEADLATKEAALQRLAAPGQQVARYRPDDKLPAFLDSL